MEAEKMEATGTEGGRRPTGVPVEGTNEVEPHAQRRPLTVAYKIRIVETVAALRKEGKGSIGAFLRKEGLYSSNVSTWERQYASGELTHREQTTASKTKALQAENQRLRRELEQVEKKLKRTEGIVEIQKKLSDLLEQTPGSETSDER